MKKKLDLTKYMKGRPKRKYATFYLKEDDIKKIKSLSVKSGLPQNAIISMCINEFIKNEQIKL